MVWEFGFVPEFVWVLEPHTEHIGPPWITFEVRIAVLFQKLVACRCVVLPVYLGGQTHQKGSQNEDSQWVSKHTSVAPTGNIQTVNVEHVVIAASGAPLANFVIDVSHFKFSQVPLAANTLESQKRVYALGNTQTL